MPNLCQCGCLRPCGNAEYFTLHDRQRCTRKAAEDYRIEDRGYTTPCWIWQLRISRFGYACIKSNGHSFHAHRYYYEQYREPIPETIDGWRAEADHLCRVRECVNPWHLEVVPQIENIRRGELLTLTEEQVREIGKRYTDGESQSQIARVLGIGQAQVSRILNGQRWKGIAQPVSIRRESNLKLSPAQVEEIRKRASAGEFQRDIAQQFGMGQSQISRIVRGESWKAATLA